MIFPRAESNSVGPVAELADALDSGSSEVTLVEVRILSGPLHGIFLQATRTLSLGFRFIAPNPLGCIALYCRVALEPTG